MQPNRLSIQRMGDIYIVDFMEPRIVDQMAISQISNELKELSDKMGMPKFVLNFGNVSHISSAMIGVIMTLQKNCKAEGGETRVACLNDNIKSVFKLCRLDKILKVYPDVDKALIKF